jgi:hypothetical protein
MLAVEGLGNLNRPRPEAISIMGDWATPHLSEPTLNVAYPMMKSRRRPYLLSRTHDVNGNEAA